MCFTSGAPRKPLRSPKLPSSTSTSTTSTSPPLRARRRDPDDLPRHTRSSTATTPKRKSRRAEVPGSTKPVRPRHSRRGSTTSAYEHKESPVVPAVRVRAGSSRRQQESPRVGGGRDTSVSDTSRRSGVVKRERMERSGEGDVGGLRPKRGEGSRTGSEAGSSRTGSEAGGRRPKSWGFLAPIGLGITTDEGGVEMEELGEGEGMRGEGSPSRRRGGSRSPARAASVRRVSPMRPVQMPVVAPAPVPESRRSSRSPSRKTADSRSPSRRPSERKPSPERVATKPVIPAPPTIPAAPISSLPPNVAVKPQRTGPTPVIKVQAAAKPATIPVVPLAAFTAPIMKPPVRRPSAGQQESTQLVRTPPEEPPALSRKSSTSTISSVLTVSTTSSEDSEDSEASDASVVSVVQVPELSPRLPNSYAHVRPPKVKAPPARIMAPSDAPVEPTPIKPPAFVPANVPEPPKRKKTRRPRPATLNLSPPVPLPAYAPPPADPRSPQRRRRSSMSKGWDVPPPRNPTAESVPQTPAHRRNGSRGSYSADTVDYAAFVADSQKKKRQPKSNVVDYTTFIPDSEKKRIPPNAVEYVVADPERKRRSRPVPITTDLRTPIPTAKRSARRTSVFTDRPPQPKLTRNNTVPPRENHMSLATTAHSGDDFPRPSSASSLDSITPASAGVRRRRNSTRDNSEQKYNNPYSSPPEAPFPPPRAPSPPPPKGKYEDRQEHHPPPGAAQSWYEEINTAPREVEQDWRTAGVVWEEGMDVNAPDGVLPEAPSPPPSDRGYTPGPQYAYGRF